MPIYEYQCESCNEVIEAWQNLSDKPMTTCPACSGTLKKLTSVSSFQLKGGGWYADGYSGSNPSSSCKSSCKADTSSSSSDSKPACSKSDTSCCGC